MKLNYDNFWEKFILIIVIFIILGLYFILHPRAAYAGVGEDFLIPDTSISSATPATIYTKADYLNIRRYPDLSAQIVDCVPYGSFLSFSSSLDGWTEIIYNNETAYVSSNYITFNENISIYSPSEFQYLGVINWGGWSWTQYTTNMFNNDIGIPNKHSDYNGYICDENDYICLASIDLSRGSIVQTPFGKMGKVYDTGCPSGVLDVYTCW